MSKKCAALYYYTGSTPIIKSYKMLRKWRSYHLKIGMHFHSLKIIHSGRNDWKFAKKRQRL